MKTAVVLLTAALAILCPGSHAQFYCWYPTEPRSPSPSCLGTADCIDFTNNACNRGSEPENSDTNDTGSSFILSCNGPSFTMYFFKNSWKCTEPDVEDEKFVETYDTRNCARVGAGAENTDRVGFYVQCNGTTAGCLSSYASTNRLDPTTELPSTVQLQDLAVGDMVESYDVDGDQKVFSEVFLIQHQDENSNRPVRRIIYETPTGEASLRATDTHYVYGPDGKVAVSDLVPGAMISVVSDDGQRRNARVISVDSVLEPIRNVHTMNNRLIVDGVLVSSFAKLNLLGIDVGSRPELMAPLKMLYRLRLLSAVNALDRWMNAASRLASASKPHAVLL